MENALCIRSVVVCAICLAGLPACLFAQWSTGPGGAIYYNGGNVGIGTGSPGWALDVAGSIRIGDLGALFVSDRTDNSLWGVYGQNSIFRIWNADVGDVFAITKSHNVGIGTTNPLARLHSTVGAGATSVIGALVYGSTGRGSFTDEAGHTHSTATLVVGSNWYSDDNGSVLNVYSAAGDGLLFVGAGGNVGVGTTNPQYRLSVNGTIQAKEVIVNTGWSDYVFDSDYKLTPLPKVAAYIKQHHHLPGVPSAAAVKQKGVSVGQMESTLLAKVEELTLHMIDAEKRDSRLEEENRKLAEQTHRLQQRVAQLEARNAR